MFSSTYRLPYNVAWIYDFAVFVNAGCARDEIHLSVRQGEAGASFEGYAIIMGGIEIFECLQVFLVAFLDVCTSEEVDGYGSMSYGEAPPMPVLAM